MILVEGEHRSDELSAIHRLDDDLELRAAVAERRAQAAVEDLLDALDDHPLDAVAAPGDGHVVEPDRHEADHERDRDRGPDRLERRDPGRLEGGDLVAGRHPAEDAGSREQHRARHRKPQRIGEHVGNEEGDLQRSQPLLAGRLDETEGEDEEREGSQGHEEHLEEFGEHVAGENPHDGRSLADCGTSLPEQDAMAVDPGKP